MSELTTVSAIDAIKNRVSVRKYTDQPVSVEEIRQVVELAGHAPSAFNVQPWRVIAITDPEVKNKLMAAAYNQPQVGAAPVVLVLTSDFEDVLENLDEIVHPGLPEDKKAGTKDYLANTFGGFSVADRANWAKNQTNIALGYLLVALEALGFGSSPMLGFDAGQVKELLGLAEHVEIPALVAFGRPAEEGYPKHRHSVDRILKIV